MILHTCYSYNYKRERFVKGGGDSWQILDCSTHRSILILTLPLGSQVIRLLQVMIWSRGQILKVVTKVAMLALLTRNLYLIRPVHMAPSILLHHHSCWDQPLKTVLALVCSKSSLIFNPRVCWLLQQCTLMNTIHFLTWVADWILPTCHWPTMI